MPVLFHLHLESLPYPDTELIFCFAFKESLNVSDIIFIDIV